MMYKKAAVLMLVLLYALLRGSATSRPGKAHNLLVIQMAKLGDMVCTTPVFRALKQSNSDIRVTVVGSVINKELLAGNQDVDGYIVFPGFFASIKIFKEGRFDAAVITGGPDFFSTAAAFLSGIPFVVAPQVTGGETPLYDVWYRLLVRLVTAVPHRMGRYAPREYLRLLEPLGIHATDTAKHLAYSPGAARRSEEFLHSLKRPVVGISPGAGNKIKQWPPERFAAVADALVRKYGASVVVLGGKRDREEGQMVLARCAEPVVEALERFTVDELKAVISRLDLFVAVDTGPIYIAEAFGVPTVDIVGPMDEREQPPQGERHAVVLPPERRAPALSLLRARWYDRAEARRQAESITVAMVMEKIAHCLRDA